MKADLEKQFPGTNVDLIEGSGGVFEVKKDGSLLFSKKQVGRFPDHAEIFNQLS